MCLCYFRFDDTGEVKNNHVTAENKKAADRLFDQDGLTAALKEVEYDVFCTRETVKPKQIPNCHFYNGAEFIRK